jgi:alkanesulfonate monooxygenase SsuD/methylene tetrahydromethanopterin reductase-like flavin-dependent oxidoreductase (luciferase family)
MKASIFCLPSVGSRAETEAGMAATRPELYQRMLKELTELVKLADDLGYDSVSFTEHHFHIEGFEVSNNPVLLDLYFAMQTKRIRVGQLGIVLPAANPIRVAEDIAMLDHMTGGRACAGFARGYQRRWVESWRSRRTASPAPCRTITMRSIRPAARRSRRTGRSSRNAGLRRC